MNGLTITVSNGRINVGVSEVIETIQRLIDSKLIESPEDETDRAYNSAILEASKIVGCFLKQKK